MGFAGADQIGDDDEAYDGAHGPTEGKAKGGTNTTPGSAAATNRRYFGVCQFAKFGAFYRTIHGTLPRKFFQDHMPMIGGCNVSSLC